MTLVSHGGVFGERNHCSLRVLVGVWDVERTFECGSTSGFPMTAAFLHPTLRLTPNLACVSLILLILSLGAGTYSQEYLRYPFQIAGRGIPFFDGSKKMVVTL